MRVFNIGNLLITVKMIATAKNEKQRPGLSKLNGLTIRTITKANKMLRQRNGCLAKKYNNR